MVPVEEHTSMRNGHISRRGRSGEHTSWAPTLEGIGPHEWKFPESAWEISERFYTGCELWEAGNTQEAFAVFQDLLQRHPEHLDVRDSLAQVYEEIGQDDRAKALLEEAVALGRRAFPKAFRAGDRLEWGWLENRPFLRCLCSLGLVYEREGRLEEALAIDQELLSLNPNDNQGVRALEVTVLFALKRPEDVITVCMAYPDDGTPEITYGRALALLQLGRDDEATIALREAVRWRPRVAAELLKTRHRRPQSSIPGYITMGGADEAYEYWQHNGQFWEETEGALSWVAETVRTVPRPRGRKKGQA
jgi:tetratricopeptide (TPR) repeat protein